MRRRVYLQDDLAAIEEATKRGVAFGPADDGLKAGILSQQENDKARVISAALERGAKTPEADVTRFAEIVTKWTGIVADIREGTWTEAQWDAYEQKLNDEIFSRYHP
ncbi:hypothetical protein GCM10011534_42780 [Pseudooceanicola nanhaiensis]|uniref:Uncharacterized protein n=1 Tax=Pseudooceanicola nanhaiensis TaxID=375761 RepID=A0A917WND9_9RHOB|nr:hypothetical protein [Pseudooceanicola nanhaiensis]GGM16267.1 hypothetical protein GCM10011534_42780 [Pseudooceanicola nanhaiensis]